MKSLVVQIAAAETLIRIRRDKDGQPWELQRALAHLEQDLFKKDLTVGGHAKACGVRQSAIQRLFRDRLKSTTWTYIRNCRMQVAASLLRQSDFEIWQICDAVGYRSLTSFCNLFKGWSGKSPTAYRNEHQEGECPRPWVHNRKFLRKLNRGELDRDRAEQAVRYLCDLYELAAGPSPSEVPESTFDEEVRAEVVWRRLRDKSFEQQKRIVGCQSGFRTAAFFNLLLEKSREEGRTTGHRRGMELAELAIASLDAVDTPAGNLPNLRARGWSRLGNARRLALDFEGAEEAFDQAQLAWSVPRKNEDPLVLADLLALKAMLRYFQRRFDEALDLNRRAIELLRGLEAPEPLAQALIAMAAMRESCGQPERAIAHLQEVLGVLEGLDKPWLRTIALCNLANAYVAARLYKEALRLLPEAKSLVAVSEVRIAPFNLQWIEGRIRKVEGAIASAEQLFVEARTGFSALGEADYEAVVSLDLALLHAEQGRFTEALRLAAGAIPFFESFSIRREATVALQLIREALSQSSLPLTVLENIRDHLEELMRDPWFGSPGRRGVGMSAAAGLGVRA